MKKKALVINSKPDSVIPIERITEKINLIRGIKVMLDRDLTGLYEVETRTLKQAVRRNIERFPPDFMFELTAEELKNWRSQFVTSNAEKIELLGFPEQGVAGLSRVLRNMGRIL